MTAAAAGVLHARLTDATMLMAMLRAVNFASFATVSISASGLEVVSEMNQTVQAHAYLYASIFDTYAFEAPANWHELVQEEEEEDGQPYICFELNVSTMVQCLTLFESHLARPARIGTRRKEVSIEFRYRAVGEPLCLTLRMDQLQMEFRLRTLDSSLAPTLEFAPDRTVAQVIMKVGTALIQSEWLSRAFQEVEQGGETRVQFQFSPRGSRRPNPGTLVLGTESTHGSTEVRRLPYQIVFPQDNQLTEKFDYPLACIRYMLQAIKTSIKTSLRMDDQGMLSAQFMMASHRANTAHPRGAPVTVAASGHAFVEFLVE